MINEEEQCPFEQAHGDFVNDLMSRLVGSTILAIAPYSETELYIVTGRDGKPTEIMIGIEDDELVISEGEMENQE